MLFIHTSLILSLGQLKLSFQDSLLLFKVGLFAVQDLFYIMEEWFSWIVAQSFPSDNINSEQYFINFFLI
jgi:hypothetical protein